MLTAVNTSLRPTAWRDNHCTDIRADGNTAVDMVVLTDIEAPGHGSLLVVHPAEAEQFDKNTDRFVTIGKRFELLVATGQTLVQLFNGL